MEIKDYLHFYIGCLCKVYYISENFQAFTGLRVGDEDVRISPQIYVLVNDNLIKVKPILRKLSDMTEDEMKEFKKLIPHIDFVRFERGDKCVYIEHEMDDKHTTRPVCTTTALIGGMPMSVMPYLLKQGFDLFGLIDAGLAIDNKSL